MISTEVFAILVKEERIIKIPTNPARQVTIKDVRMCKGNIAHEYMKANPITAIKK